MVRVGGPQLVDLGLDASVAAEAALGGVEAVCARLDELVEVGVDVVYVEEGCDV